MLQTKRQAGSEYELQVGAKWARPQQRRSLPRQWRSSCRSTAAAAHPPQAVPTAVHTSLLAARSHRRPWRLFSAGGSEGGASELRGGSARGPDVDHWTVTDEEIAWLLKEFVPKAQLFNPKAQLTSLQQLLIPKKVAEKNMQVYNQVFSNYPKLTSRLWSTMSDPSCPDLTFEE